MLNCILDRGRWNFSYRHPKGWGGVVVDHVGESKYMYSCNNYTFYTTLVIKIIHNRAGMVVIVSNNLIICPILLQNGQ